MRRIQRTSFDRRQCEISYAIDWSKVSPLYLNRYERFEVYPSEVAEACEGCVGEEMRIEAKVLNDTIKSDPYIGR